MAADSRSTSELAGADTVFLIGNGGVSGGWQAVIEAINAVAPVPISMPAEANFWLAQHVYSRRVMSQTTYPDRAELENAIESSAQRDREVKTEIAARLISAERDGKIKLRPRLVDAFAEKRFEGAKLFLTTNWDRLLEGSGLPPLSVVHLHGSVVDPKSLFLPSEITPEKYRSETEHKKMGLYVGTLWQQLARAKQVCIYGLSLSDLDAEVAFTVGIGLRERLRLGHRCRVTIFDTAKAIAAVERRLQLLLDGATNVDVTLEPQ